MKTPRFNPDERWENLIRQAQADRAPPVDVAALVRLVRETPFVARESWAAEFAALFASGRFVPACLGAAGVLVVFASWQAWETWQALPWAQLAFGFGGVQ